jgi:hypothetical protein
MPVNGNHIIKMKINHAAIDNGSATINPRAKLRRSPCACSSTPEPGGSSNIQIASSTVGRQLILSNRLGSKYCPERSETTRPGIGALNSRLTSIFDIISIIACVMIEALPASKPRFRRAIRIKPQAGQVKAKSTKLRPITALACVLLSRPALAQNNEAVTPIDLFKPERGEGIRISPGLLLYPSVESDVTYDGNVYNTNQVELDDLVASIRPRFTMRTDLPRHRFSLTAGTDIRRHVDIASENNEQFDIQGKGIIDLAERTQVIADAGFRRGIDQRGTAGDQFQTDAPVAYNRTFGGIVARRTGGFLELTTEARIAETRYRDTQINGLTVDLSDRDSRVMRARIRGSAPSSHYSRVFVEASINKVDYMRSVPVQRDSSGYAVLAGMLLRLTDLVDLEVGVGHIWQNFRNGSIKDVRAANYHLQVQWTPRPDWQVTAAANRAIEPSARQDVAAIVQSDFSIEALKVFGERMLVSAEIGISNEKYQGSGRKDLRLHASTQVHYRLTDNVGLIAKLGWRKQDGNALGRDYSGVTATLGVRARF